MRFFQTSLGSVGRLGTIATFIFLLLAWQCGPALAGEVDDLAKQASAALRSAKGNITNGKLDEARKGAEEAVALIEKVRAADPQHKQLNSLDKQLEGLKKDIARAEGKIERQKQSDERSNRKQEPADAAARKDPRVAEWLAKLQPYVTPGDPKRLIASASRNSADLQARQQIYADAAATLAEYQKAEFPVGKSDELVEVEKELDQATKDFAKSCVEYAEQDLKSADDKLTYADKWLAKQEAKKDPKDPPLYMQKDQLREILDLIDSAATLIARNDPRFASLRERMAAIEQRDLAIRKARIDLTRMLPDRWKGDAMEDLKAKAVAVVGEKFSGATVLRTTLISENWKEESALESTDTTNTALRFRVTRRAIAQVAAKVGGEVWLYTLNISKDRQSDGTWGELQGHIMFTDPILEQNVALDGK